MRIAVNATFVSERHNGTTTFVDGMLQSLGSMGHEVIVYSSSERYRDFNGIELKKTPRSIRADGSGTAAVKRFAWMQSELPRQLKRDSVDLFLAPTVEGLLRCPVPQVLTVHDLIPLFYREECPRLYHYYKWVLPRMLRNAQRTLAVSEHTRRDVIEQYALDPARVTVVYNGLREELFDPQFGNKPEGFDLSAYFLFVGNFSPRKNLETVIRAFARIHSDVPEKLVVVAYPDRWQASILRQASELGISHKMVFYSGLADPELAYLYRKATAVVLLSEYEGFGYPPLEAMASGTPAVVSDATSLSEVVGDAGITSLHWDVDAAATAMQRLSQDNGYREALQRRGRSRASQFTWANTTRQILNALHA
jgi:glycosyltransferase involved in cell wall biosynthesis